MTHNIKQLLSDLIHQDKIVREELLDLVDTAQAASPIEGLPLLQQIVEDTQRYERWFSDVLEQLKE